MPFIAAFLSLFLLFQTETTVVHWLTPTEHNFGVLEQDEPDTYIFRFKNISKDTLLIDNVRTTCGCTASDWTEAPILPNHVSEIKIEYDARKVGWFRKKIRVYFNKQRKAELLYISGEVETAQY